MAPASDPDKGTGRMQERVEAGAANEAVAQEASLPAAAASDRYFNR